jgi:hypothetical protein
MKNVTPYARTINRMNRAAVDATKPETARSLPGQRLFKFMTEVFVGPEEVGPILPVVDCKREVAEGETNG